MPEFRTNIFFITALILLSTTVHFRILFNDFVWDDDYAIVNNEEIRDLSNILGFFTKPWPDKLPLAGGGRYTIGYSGNYYRPLPLVTYAIEYSIFGLNSTASHLTNLLIHIICSVLIYLIIARLSCGGFPAFIGALFFSIHPVHTETLNVVSYRGTLLSGMFTCLSLLVFLSTKRLPARFILIPALLALALVSKETSAAIPLVLVTASIHTGEISIKKGFAGSLKSSLFLLPLFSLIALYFLLRSHILTGETQSFFEGLSYGGGILMIFKVFYQYVRLVFFPHPLSPFYDWSVIGVPDRFADYEVVTGLLFISASTFSFFYFLRRSPLVSFAIAIFFIELLPVSHIIPFIVPFAERFLYIPLIGAAVILSALIGTMLKRRLNTGVVFITALLIIPASAASFIRNGEWKSTISILEANVRDFPNSFNAHFSLGKLLMDSDRRRSEEHLKAAIRIMPGVPVTYAFLAAEYILEGRHAEASELLDRAPEKDIVVTILNSELSRRRADVTGSK